MMTKPAAFAGSYCDLKFIKSRSVAQITVEIPIERAAEFVAAFGTPNPAEECPVALARINPAKTGEKPASEAPTQDNEPKERKRFAEMSYAQQTGIRCGDQVFATFVKEQVSRMASSARPPNADPADYVRSICKVASRAEIMKGTPSGERWEWIEGAFIAWKAA